MRTSVNVRTLNFNITYTLSLFVVLSSSFFFLVLFVFSSSLVWENISHCLSLARFLSALAGFIEPGETPEDAARREVFEEVGVSLDSISYQFSQPWPFPCSLMMGFIATTKDRTLTLDREEIEEARWISREEVYGLIHDQTENHSLCLPPEFTIARQLIARWLQLSSTSIEF